MLILGINFLILGEAAPFSLLFLREKFLRKERTNDKKHAFIIKSTNVIFVKCLINKIFWLFAARKTDSKQPENIDKEIIEILKCNGKISRKDLALILNKTEGSIRHHLNKLQEKWIIKHQGQDKGGYWEVIYEA